MRDNLAVAAPHLAVRAIAVGVVSGIAAFLLGLGVIPLVVPEPDQHGAVETVFSAFVFAVGAATAYLVAARHGSSLGTRMTAGLATVIALGAIVVIAQWFFLQVVLGGDGIGPDN
jgi:hypothetical protein